MFLEFLKKQKLVRRAYYLLQGVSSFLQFNPILLVKQYLWFLKEFRLFSNQKKNKNFKKIRWLPCLTDNLKYTPLEPTYFFQDSWAAKHLFTLKPKHHYDVGSSAKTIGILSQFTPITMIDIRPIELELDGLFFQKGSILDLPFDDNSLDTLSSLCVVEHIGLGRYGDKMDSFGSEKAIKELKRVLKVGGVLLLSVPIDSENKIYFNAHRAFTRDYIIELLDDFKVIDERYHYGTKVFDKYDASKGFGTGLYMMEKVK